MPVTDVPAIKTHTLLDTDPAEKVANYADEAEATLRVLVTDAVYDDIAGGSDAKYEKLQRAESYLCLWAAIPFLNLRPTDTGGLSKIIGYGDQTHEKLMSKAELDSYRGRFYAEAVNVIDDIRPGLDGSEDVYNAGPLTIA